ncbi:MAG: tRNA (adenosine(37)-N6)-threonylcarbamoyltransferase complex ATPase subunit type 1 TsaE [Treponema sp.]|jgi:tRNA threonylcarbamoyladenosine biosynthesis protein TsaE|nr:tRNA (adenosine(37)-N6)-threonylcarbamoyltransferase complex ATPase subunit type 1 TsaE [Treponema sp.]
MTMERCRTEHSSFSPEETEALGERLAGTLKPGALVALRGGLGAGKTCLAKGIARGLGVAENVASPTYTVVNEYGARINGEAFPFYHIDAYRLGGDEDFENSGAGEFIGRGIGVIEWSERVPRSIPADAVIITIEITGPESRKITINEELKMKV